MIKSNIILIGMMGSGKSTIGKILSECLKLNFLDLDEELTKYFQRSIPEIFEELGEKAFREAEAQKLQQIKTPAVISTGGGIVLKQENREFLKNLGFVIWLKASDKAIFERLKNDQARPLLKALNQQAKLEKIQKLLQERESLYAEIADLTIETNDFSPTEIGQTTLENLD